MSLAAHAETQPEPRTRPLKAPAKKSAARKPAAKKSAAKSRRPAPKTASAPRAKPEIGKARPLAKAKPASKATPTSKPKPGTKAAPAAAKAKPGTKASPAAKAKPGSKAKPAARAKPEKVKRFRPAPRPKDDLPPKEPLPEIPAELLEDAPRAKKPRKPRGRKAEAPKPVNALDIILSQLDDAKAEQVVSIPLDDKRAVADAVVVASGRSNRHVGAIADQLVQKLKEKGYRDIRVQGMPQCDWVLVDIGDVIVHIFRPEVRSFYNLEKLLSASAPDDWAAV